MSKLPMFNSGQLQALTRQPVMQDGKKQHVQFCKYVEELTGMKLPTEEQQNRNLKIY